MHDNILDDEIPTSNRVRVGPQETRPPGFWQKSEAQMAELTFCVFFWLLLLLLYKGIL